MRSFSQEYVANRLIISPAISKLAGQIREFKGKQALYAERKPEVLESLRQVSFIESVESSNRLERIETDSVSLKKLVDQKMEPENRPQTALAGYRDVLNIIHQNHGDMPFTVNTVLQLHKSLFQHSPEPGGLFKSAPNNIVEHEAAGNVIRVRFRTVAPHLTDVAMQDLHDGYAAALDEYDPLILIPNYVHDFLCIHPFNDGNGRMVRLLTALLLYKHGFDVARYISLEKLVEETKSSYYASLNDSDEGWHEGQHDQRPFTQYLLGVILAAYRKLSEDLEKIQDGRGYKSRLVKQAIESVPQVFSSQDVRTHCPSVSSDTVRNVLRTMKENGEIESLGTGRGAKWRKRG